MGLSVITRAIVLSLVLCAVLATPSVPHAPEAPTVPAAVPTTPPATAPTAPAALPATAPSVPHAPAARPTLAPGVPSTTAPTAHVEESEHGSDSYIIHDEKYYTPKAALTTAASMGIIGGIIGFLFLLFIIMIFLCNKAASKHHAADPHHVAGHLATPTSAVPLGSSYDAKFMSPVVAQSQAAPSFQALTGPVFLSPSQTPFHSRAPSDAADEFNNHTLAGIAHPQAAYGVGSSAGGVYGQPPVPPPFPNAS